MAIQPAAALPEQKYYLQPIPLVSIPPPNIGLRSAEQPTMISILGSPQLPLTTTDQPDRASARVKALARTEQVAAHVRVTGIGPALDSLTAVLKAAFLAEKGAGHDLESVLATEGMLNVRYRKPTSGAASTLISNHSWGTAIDFTLLGLDAPGNTHDAVPRFISVLIPHFNRAGWYSGVGFHDSMHFELAEGTIHDWAGQGKFN